MPRKRWWHVELPRELQGRVKVAAAIAHQPMSEWIARAIEQRLSSGMWDITIHPVNPIVTYGEEETR